jgi:hypothetical protein
VFLPVYSVKKIKGEEVFSMENESFEDLFDQGYSLQRKDAPGDAVYYYERALRAPDAREDQKLSAKRYLARCYIYLGRNEATALLDEVIAASENIDSEEMFDFSYHSRYDQILNFRAVMESEPSPEKIQHLLNFIQKDCLDWLCKYDREYMKAPLLVEMAIAYFYQGNYDLALDTAEESYSLPKYLIEPQYHALIVARYARKVKNYERALEVLDKSCNEYVSTYSRVQLLTERLRLLLELKPQKIQEAVDISRNLTTLLIGITTKRARIEAFCEMGRTYLCAKMYDKCLDALQNVHEICVKENEKSYHKKYLARKGSECYADCLSIIKAEPDGYPPQIHQQITRWLSEISKMYSS